MDEINSRQDEDSKDSVGAKYLKVINSVSFSDLTIYTVELPVSEHNKPEVKLAMKGKIKNLIDYDVFEEVSDVNQECIRSHMMITAKEKQDGQKQQVKVRLVDQGFKEELKSQSDSPTGSKDSFKLLMAIAANDNFKLASVDIRAPFL